jgi:hypothetical protein
MQDDQRGAGAEGHVVDEDAVGVNEALLLWVYGGLSDGRGSEGGGEKQSESEAQIFHEDENTATSRASDLSC